MLFSSSNFGLKSTATKKDRSSRENIVTILFIAVTIALEYFLESGIFICPEERYYSYSITFLLGPCIPLYCLSLILSYEFNRTLSGFCVFWMNRGIQKNRFRNRLRYFLRNVFTSFIKCFLAPATWFTIALMKKQMYVCAKVGPKSIHLGNNVTEAKYEELAGRAQSESQIFGWLIFMSGITIASIAFTIKQCFTLSSNEPGKINWKHTNTDFGFMHNVIFYELYWRIYELLNIYLFKADNGNTRKRSEIFKVNNKDTRMTTFWCFCC